MKIGDTGVSIPIAYCIDKDGKVIFISMDDTRNRILDMTTKELSFSQAATWQQADNKFALRLF